MKLLEGNDGPGGLLVYPDTRNEYDEALERLGRPAAVAGSGPAERGPAHAACVVTTAAQRERWGLPDLAAAGRAPLVDEAEAFGLLGDGASWAAGADEPLAGAEADGEPRDAAVGGAALDAGCAPLTARARLDHVLGSLGGADLVGPVVETLRDELSQALASDERALDDAVERARRVLSLPWRRRTPERFDPAAVARTLDRTHGGKSLLRGGPGAAGRIVEGLCEADVNNPVFILEGIDQVDPEAADALLDVLDPEHRTAFRDRYVVSPFDLSGVLWLVTATAPDAIPESVRPRLELIELEGYGEEEKFEIAQRYLLARPFDGPGPAVDRAAVSVREAGLPSAVAAGMWRTAASAGRVRFEDEAVRLLIRAHTDEVGVAGLAAKLAAICRQVVRRSTNINRSPDPECRNSSSIYRREGKSRRRAAGGGCGGADHFEHGLVPVGVVGERRGVSPSRPDPC